MSSTPDRAARRLDQAEGYLMLNLPERALEILDARPFWGSMQFEASFLTGEARRQLGQFREAIPHLERAARLQPGNVGVALSLGWCYKRTHRLAQAIDALERALKANPDEALLFYNLACYWSLAGQPRRAIGALSRALELDPNLRGTVLNDSDFQTLRTEPDFQRLIRELGEPTTSDQPC
jgi:tetratricopeptide (TPR) repeat protein